MIARDTEIGTTPPDPVAAAQAAARQGVVRIVPPPNGARGVVDFLRANGPLMFTVGETPAHDAPELNVVTNVGRQTPPRSVFHSDTSYDPAPPSYSALIAIDVPDEGGATLFTDQYAALDALEPDMRQMLAGATVLHGPTDVPPTEAVWHPLIRRNPGSNRDALFLTSVSRCQRLRLSCGRDRHDLIEPLYTHSITFQRPKRHRWRPGDVLLWDNRCTLHAADHSAVVGARTLYRGLIRGEQPVSSQVDNIRAT